MNCFITGTGTGCGKTLVTLTLMAALDGRVAGMKPVAAGAEATPRGLRNQDALALQTRSRPVPPYSLVNPCCLATPAAPHLAARAEQRPIDTAAILEAADQLRRQTDHLLVEGAGGWRVPLTETMDMAGLCRALELPAVLVVGLELGCLNHALLTAEAIQADGVELLGWVATSLHPNLPFEQENLDTLRKRLDAPLLGHLGWQAAPDPDRLAARLQSNLKELQGLGH